MNKKIKIIELLNKIANGEEVPKKIKREYGLVYTLNFGHETPTYYDDNDRTLWDGYNFNILNEDVEILEDNTEEIEEIKEISDEYFNMLSDESKVKWLKSYIKEDKNKINELVKAVNKLRKENKK